MGDLKSTLSPTARARQRLTERRARADDVVLDAALLDRAVEVGVDVVVALVAELHHRARLHGLAVGALHDLAVLEHGGQLPDPGLHLALVVLGGVVVAVLLQVAQLPGGLDLPGDVDPADRGELVVLGLQPVVRLLGEVVRLRHT